MSGLLLDLRLVLRASRRQRASTIATVLTLAVGVCALAAALAVARAALVTPFPYERPEELVDLQSMRVDEPGARFGIYPADFLAWREGGRSFAGMAGPTFKSYVFSTPGLGGADIVRIKNNLPDPHIGFGVNRTTTHLHGLHVEARSDGFPEPMEKASQFLKHLARIDRSRVYARTEIRDEVAATLRRRA